ncbi:redoxin domain-containing protein [Ectothiorhodospiraceae bacterium 2226]|nr:redoxin domain-containing protein [Ectothiorhodospiraceae bacterium 2226]
MNRPELGAIVPNFRLLPAIRAQRSCSLLDYRQIKPVVLVLCGRECGALLDGFARHYAEYREAGAEVLAVVQKPPQGMPPPFPLVRDADGQVTARLAERTPTVLLLDSYGELQARHEGPWPDGPNHRDLVHHIIRLEMQCPECGAPAWAQFQ